MAAPYPVMPVTPVAGPPAPAAPPRRFGVASPMMSDRMPSTVSVSAGSRLVGSWKSFAHQNRMFTLLSWV